MKGREEDACVTIATNECYVNHNRNDLVKIICTCTHVCMFKLKNKINVTFPSQYKYNL